MISVLLPYTKPGVEAGGPLQSIVRVCDYLEKEYDYQIVTKCNNFKNTAVEDTEARHKVLLLPKFTFRELLPIINKSSVVWINSIYSVPFSFMPLVTLLFSKRTTVLISARGQLLQGSINFKKKIYLQAYSFLLKISRNRVYLHYSTEEEKEKSYPIFKDFDSLMFANPLNNKFTNPSIKTHNKSRYVLGYLGRIAPIKNIEFIIQLMPKLPAHIVFHIYGVVADIEYEKKLKKRIYQLGLQDRVVFKGAYAYNEINACYNEVDLAVIPSKSENFCYSFFEAIENKTPIIASNGLPWNMANTFQEETILPLKSDVWIAKIVELSLTSNKINTKKQGGLEQFYKFVASSVKEDTLQSFKTLT